MTTLQIRKCVFFVRNSEWGYALFNFMEGNLKMKRIISILLTLTILLTLVPTICFANLQVEMSINVQSKFTQNSETALILQPT